MEPVHHRLAQLVDIDELRRIFEDINAVSGISLGVQEIDGTHLFRIGWADICTLFHRRNPTTLEGCLESDARITAEAVGEGDRRQTFAYQCSNGLWDVAFPLVVDGEHIATAFMGQFFYDDDIVDVEAFRARAAEAGFDTDAYLEALGRVPVVTHEHVDRTARLLSDLVALLGETGLAQLRWNQEHAALLESEQRLRLANEATNDVVWDLDIVHDSQRWIAAGETVFGWTEALDSTTSDAWWSERVHPDDSARVHESYNRVVDDPAATNWVEEYRFRRADGSYAEVLDRGHVLRDCDGSARRMIGAMLDISGRRRAEEELRQSRRQYETFINATDDLAFLKDDQLRYIIVNTANAAFFGRSVEEVVGRTDEDLMPATAAEACRASDLEAIETHGVVVSHEEIDGRVFETRKFPVDLGGDQTGVGGYVRDVTERTLAERALEKRVVALTRPLDDPSAIAFEELFDLADIQRLQDGFAAATGVASIITHPDGTPITEPSGFCTLCKDVIRGTEKGRVNCFESDAALGRLEADGPVVQPCLSGGLWDAGAGIAVGGRHIANWLIGQVRDETQTEAQMAAYAREIGADEEEFLAAFREVPAMSHAQFERVAGALYSLASQLSTTAYQNVQQARFIAEQKATEAEVARLNADLERRVDQRTAQLKATNQELESFAYSISHDLRSPLRALDGFSEILLQDYGETLDDAGRDYLRRIKSAANHMAGLMDGLLQLSRLNRDELDFKDVDVSALADSFVAELRERDPARDVVVDIAPGLVARADPKLMRAVLENLLGNAWKFTARHEKAHVEFGADQTDGGTAFYVRDDGAGFDMRYAGNLFGAFQRLHTPDQFEGTGIGLATVQRIVHRHGGTVWAEGEVEKGATFWFTLEPPGAA